jgi:hypothetical protein
LIVDAAGLSAARTSLATFVALILVNSQFIRA